jgi:shikimate kinase
MIRKKVRAVTHGAISIVNAIATGKGSALGISLTVTAEAELRPGHGVQCPTTSAKLMRNIVFNTIPESIISENSVCLSVKSQIPAGVGLKSSSAVSSAVALACSKLVKDKINDHAVLDTAVRASLDAGITITGAYDDSAASYFGGFVVTDNYTLEIKRYEKAQENLYATIFLPHSAPRGDIHKLNLMSNLSQEAIEWATVGEYWKAMNLNGMVLSSCLSKDYYPAVMAIQKGALAASMSGNGPSIAAVSYEEKLADINSCFSKLNGMVIVSKINNDKASVETLIGKNSGNEFED